MNILVIREAAIVNEGGILVAGVLVRNGILERIAQEALGSISGAKDLDAQECRGVIREAYAQGAVNTAVLGQSPRVDQ